VLTALEQLDSAVRGAVLRVQTPTVAPLDRRQTALTLSLSGDESSVTVELDDVQRERLARALDESSDTEGE